MPQAFFNTRQQLMGGYMLSEQFGGFYEFDENEVKDDKASQQKHSSFADYQEQNQEPEITRTTTDDSKNMPEIDDYISDEVFMAMQDTVQGKYEKQFVAMYTFLQNALNLAYRGDKENPVILDNLFKLVDKRSDSLLNDARMQNWIGITHLKPSNMSSAESLEQEGGDMFTQQQNNYFTKVNPADVSALATVRAELKEVKTSAQKRAVIFSFLNINPSHPNLLLPAFNIPQDCFPLEAYLAQAIAGINEVRSEKDN